MNDSIVSLGNIIKQKMNIIIVLLMNLSVALNGFICTKAVLEGKNDPLPDKRPEKLVIEYHVSGGMMYYSEAIYISEDSSYYTVNHSGAISRVNFKLTPEELDKLYKVFVENDFDRIKTYNEKVYDRGGETIFLRWANGKFASASNSGMTFIDDDWKKEWSACENAIEKIITMKSETGQKDFMIQLDKSTFGKEMNIYLNNKPLMTGKDPGLLSSSNEIFIINTKLMPGNQWLSVNREGAYDNFAVSADSSGGINIFVKNDSLKHSYIKH